MSLRRSVVAVASTFALVILVQQALSLALRLPSPTLDAAHLQGGVLTGTLVGAYLLGFGATAIVAGVTLGRLVPDKPSLHVAVVACLSPLLGYLSSGAAAIPHGWQVVSYGLQLVAIESITLAVFKRRGGPTAGLFTRPA
jgi:hypothetical protein